MRKIAKKSYSNWITYGIVIAAFVICQMMISNGSMSRSMKGQLVPICCWVSMAVSLNLVVGISGELSLGHAGFMSVGAFSGVVTSSWLLSAFGMENELLRMILSMIVGGTLAGFAGVVIGIPVLRLRGDYLAIVTLAFGEIIRNVLNCVYISVDGKNLNFGFLNPNLAGTLILNGPNGASGIKKIATFNMGFVLVMLTLFVVLNLVNSRSGRAIKAIRDNRIAAEATGINTTKYRMMAFVTSAVLAGIAGALYGLNFSSMVPGKFKFDQSILVLVFVVLGGIGSIRGSVIAAAVLTILPEALRKLMSVLQTVLPEALCKVLGDFDKYRMLVYAIVLILMMLLTNNKRMIGMLNAFREKLQKKEQNGGASA